MSQGRKQVVAKKSSGSLAERPQWVGVGDNVGQITRIGDGSEGDAIIADSKDGRQSLLYLPATAQQHVAAYLEYHRIVGDADGGKLFSEEEYEDFKRAAIEARANRLYVFWRCLTNGIDCRAVGPSSPCFCGHTYRQHATDNVANKDVRCRQAGCKCALYNYIPKRGTQDVKCNCKHSFDQHQVTGSKKCRSCTSCSGFTTSLSCSCLQPYGAHETVFETREEREATGRPVENLAGGGQGYEAMGGITNFSSLIDGVDRISITDGGRSNQGLLHGSAASASSGSDFNPSTALMQQAPPGRKEKFTQEDEMALYEQKYKKGGSAYSQVSSSTYAAKKNRAAAAARERFGGPGGALGDEAQSSAAAASSASASAAASRALYGAPAGGGGYPAPSASSYGVGGASDRPSASGGAAGSFASAAPSSSASSSWTTSSSSYGTGAYGGSSRPPPAGSSSQPPFQSQSRPGNRPSQIPPAQTQFSMNGDRVR